MVNCFYNILFRWPYRALVTIFSRLGDMAEFAGRSNTIDENAIKVHPFYAMNTTDKDSNHILGVVAIIGTIFGSIHSASWNFLFPTSVEATIWRTCSLIVTGVPCVMLIFVCCSIVYQQTDTFWLKHLLRAIGYILAPGLYRLAYVHHCADDAFSRKLGSATNSPSRSIDGSAMDFVFTTYLIRFT